MKKILVSTLCVLFVAACTTPGKRTAIGAGAGAAIGAGAGALISHATGGKAGTGALIGKHMDKVKAQAEAVQNAKVESVTDANGLQAVKVSFDSGILFATNKADLNASAKNSLAKFANVLKGNSDCDIAIYGHTDTTGNDAINIPLSEKRAASVQNYLLGQGVSASQIKTCAGQGSSNPVADNSTAAGRQQNRRVEVYMYASQAMIEAANNGTLQ